MPDLAARLLAAHKDGQVSEMISLYGEAAETSDDEDREAFFLTHAWVFALEHDDPRANDFHKRLQSLGRAD